MHFQVHFSAHLYNGNLFAEGSEYGVFGVREAYTDYLILNFPLGAKTYPLPPKVRKYTTFSAVIFSYM